MPWVLLNCAATHNHPRPATNLQPPPRSAITLSSPPTTSHNFTATTHNHPRATIIKPPSPTNNDSLPTVLLTIKNSELYFCHDYWSPRRIQEQSKFIRQYPPNTNKKSFFRKQEQFLLSIYTLLMPLKTKIKKPYYLTWLSLTKTFYH